MKYSWWCPRIWSKHSTDQQDKRQSFPKAFSSKCLIQQPKLRCWHRKHSLPLSNQVCWRTSCMMLLISCWNISPVPCISPDQWWNYQLMSASPTKSRGVFKRGPTAECIDEHNIYSHYQLTWVTLMTQWSYRRTITVDVDPRISFAKGRENQVKWGWETGGCGQKTRTKDHCDDLSFTFNEENHTDAVSGRVMTWGFSDLTSWAAVIATLSADHKNWVWNSDKSLVI